MHSLVKREEIVTFSVQVRKNKSGYPMDKYISFVCQPKVYFFFNLSQLEATFVDQ